MADKKVFTDESLSTFVDEIKAYTDAAAAKKSDTSHTHKYAGSSSAGGAATSANKLNTDAGSTTNPVYFANGIPVKTTYTLGKSVPSDAKFTDTTYSDATTSASGLMSSADKSKVNYTNIAYGTCSTAAATAAKDVTIGGNTNWALTAGSVVYVYFSNTNTAESPTLNVNGTGAKNIYYGSSQITTSSLGYGGTANRLMIFIYDGTQYRFAGWGYDSNTTYTNVKLGHGYTTCSTAAATIAKTASLSSYTLTTGGIVAVKFTYAVPASATLNINSKGAKAIYHEGAAIKAGVIEAGDIATFIYSSQYHLISINKAGVSGTGIVVDGYTINHSNSVTAGTAKGDDTKTLSFGGTFTIPTVTYDAQGHVTGKGTTTMTMPANPNSDSKVKNTLATTTKAYVTGTTSATTSTGEQVFDTGVYLDTTAGRLTATSFKGNLIGTAEKATSDGNGNNIASTYGTITYVDRAITDAIEYTDTKISKLTTADASVTPSGTVTSTFKGTAASHNHTFTGTTIESVKKYTPAGTVSKPTFTGTAATSAKTSDTTTVYSITGVGSVPSLTASVSNRCLTLTFGEGSVPTRSSVTVPTFEHTHSVTATGTVSQPSFTGTEAEIKMAFTPLGTVESKSVTPAGTVTSTFEGTAGSHSHTVTSSTN